MKEKVSTSANGNVEILLDVEINGRSDTADWT